MSLVFSPAIICNVRANQRKRGFCGINEVYQPNVELGPLPADTAEIAPFHGASHKSEDVFYAATHLGLRPIGFLLCIGQRCAPAALFTDMCGGAFREQRCEVGIGTVGINVGVRIG